MKQKQERAKEAKQKLQDAEEARQFAAEQDVIIKMLGEEDNNNTSNCNNNTAVTTNIEEDDEVITMEEAEAEEEKEELGDQSLITAVQLENIKQVKSILAKNPSIVSVVDASGDTALHHAVKHRVLSMYLCIVILFHFDYYYSRIIILISTADIADRSTLRCFINSPANR